MLHAFRNTLVARLSLGLLYGLQFGVPLLDRGAARPAFMVALIALVAGTLLALAHDARSAGRVARAMLVEQPVDAILLDLGHSWQLSCRPES